MLLSSVHIRYVLVVILVHICGLTPNENSMLVSGQRFDECPSDPDKIVPGRCGCNRPETDRDYDGQPDCVDVCPDDPGKDVTEGRCGCGNPETDTDNDGQPDCVDVCPYDPFHTNTLGQCGCGVSERDRDGDGHSDCVDICPDDPEKTRRVGSCGCGNSEYDRDNDGTPDCIDVCPDDPQKTRGTEGRCGCGHPETDDDGDGTPNCVDECPHDPKKSHELQCGCGIDELDSDGDGVMDCVDSCPYSEVSGGYCGTFMPCDDIQCHDETEACRADSDCDTALSEYESGDCQRSTSAFDCWWNDLRLRGDVNPKFEKLFDCFRYCERLGQCNSDSDCSNGGNCYIAPFGAKFCKCPHEWLGWDCSIKAQFDEELQSNGLYLSWTTDDHSIYLQFRCRTEGWCAFQIGESEVQMTGAFPIAGSVAADGRVFMADLHSPGGAPADDTSVPAGTYDLYDISGWREGAWEIFRTRTPLDSGDPLDFQFARYDRELPSSWARGEFPLNVGMDYHGLPNREFVYIDFNLGIEQAYQQSSSPPTYSIGTNVELPYDCALSPPGSPMQLFWTLSGDSIDIAFVADVDDDSWVGIAFSPHGGMEDADAVISTRDGFVDQYNLRDEPYSASRDSRDGLEDTKRTYKDGKVITEFSRSLETRDSTDMDISVTDLMYILWAVGPQREPDYHGVDRDSIRVNFGECGTGTPSQDSPSEGLECENPTRGKYIGRVMETIFVNNGAECCGKCASDSDCAGWSVRTEDYKCFLFRTVSDSDTSFDGWLFGTLRSYEGTETDVVIDPTTDTPTDAVIDPTTDTPTDTTTEADTSGCQMEVGRANGERVADTETDTADECCDKCSYGSSCEVWTWHEDSHECIIRGTFSGTRSDDGWYWGYSP